MNIPPALYCQSDEFIKQNGFVQVPDLNRYVRFFDCHDMRDKNLIKVTVFGNPCYYYPPE